METLSPDQLRKVCPVKWHDEIPVNGISFGVADIDFKGPEGIVEFIRDSLAEGFSFYQDQSGLDVALQSIIGFLADRKIQATKKNIQVIPGTMLGIYTAMKYASRRSGDVVCVSPLYEPIHRHATDTGNEVDWVPIYEKGVDLDVLTEKVNKKTALIAINNPTNPIGHVFSRSDLHAIRDLAVEYDIPCFSDELYEPLVFSKSHIPIASLDGMQDRTIALYGFSKAYGLAGYRSGFLNIGESLSEEIKKIVEAQLVSPSPIASLVCKYALEDSRAQTWVDQFRSLMAKNTKIAAQLFLENGYPCRIPDSCFFVYPNIGRDDEQFATELLKNQGVQVVPGNRFGPTGKNHIRINCATSLERLREGFNRILIELDTA
ncbi:MAG: pyridoxal phosphate-dependent aminotransferase [Candidatus Kariarchaeaceae archaeon]